MTSGGSYDRDDVKIKGVDSSGVDREITAIADGSDYRLATYATIEGDVDSINHVHYKIHEGKHYIYTTNQILGNNNYYDVYFSVGSGAEVPHVTWRTEITEDLEINIYEGATITAGAALNFKNNNRNYADT